MSEIFFVDQWVYAQVREMDFSWWLNSNRFLSFLGDGSFLYPLVGLGALFLFAKKRWKEGIWALSALWLSIELNSLAKNFFERPRPLSLYPGLSWDTYAFPSGHAFGSLFAYGMVFWILRRMSWKWGKNRLAFYGVIILVGLIGSSRIALGAHWLTDVLAGYLMGLIWLGLNIWFCRKFGLFSFSTPTWPSALSSGSN